MNTTTIPRVGMWSVTVRAHEKAVVDGWTRCILDTPTFLIGAVAGQAMTECDARVSVERMFDYALRRANAGYSISIAPWEE